MKEIYDFKEIEKEVQNLWARNKRYEANIDTCLLYTSPSPRD